MKLKLTKTKLLTILTGIFTASLIISNVLASKTFEVFGIILPTAVIIFPIVYIVNDILAEIYGFKEARKIILLGFVMNAIAVIAYWIAIVLPAPGFATGEAEAFQIVLGSSWRVLLASFSAYLVGSLLNAFVMTKLKEKLKNALMFRCVFSTLIGEGIDALIFITIAFAGTMPVSTLFIMIAAQAAFKTIYEIVVYPLTRACIKKANQLEE